MLFSNEIDSNRSGDDFKRLSVKYEDLSKRFHFQTKNDYSKQYAHIYATRLNDMRGLLTQRARDKWGTSLISMYFILIHRIDPNIFGGAGTEYPLKRMGDLREEQPEKCILIGTLFVHQKLKPSILRDISEETQLAPQPVRSHFVDESDQLILEDELQRIRLFGKMQPHDFVTGIVCAILGMMNDLASTLCNRPNNRFLFSHFTANNLISLIEFE